MQVMVFSKISNNHKNNKKKIFNQFTTWSLEEDCPTFLKYMCTSTCYEMNTKDPNMNLDSIDLEILVLFTVNHKQCKGYTATVIWK
jgi:hypothetical protein